MDWSKIYGELEEGEYKFEWGVGELNFNNKEITFKIDKEGNLTHSGLKNI